MSHLCRTRTAKVGHPNRLGELRLRHPPWTNCQLVLFLPGDNTSRQIDEPLAVLIELGRLHWTKTPFVF